MAIFNKSLESAQQAVTKAEATVAEWEEKAAKARTEAAELDANSGALILEDASQAEKISLNIQTLERTARAYDGAASEARRKLRDAQLKVLETEAVVEDKAAKDAVKERAAHKSKVDALLAQLEEVDGCAYMPDNRMKQDPTTAEWFARVPKDIGLQRNVRHHRLRAASIRYYLEHGKVPSNHHELDVDLDLGPMEMFGGFNEGDNIPASVYAARDAGIVPESVGA